jgi:hypothetical protein
MRFQLCDSTVAGILHTIMFNRALGLVRPREVDSELFEITYVCCFLSSHSFCKNSGELCSVLIIPDRTEMVKLRIGSMGKRTYYSSVMVSRCSVEMQPQRRKLRKKLTFFLHGWKNIPIKNHRFASTKS